MPAQQQADGVICHSMRSLIILIALLVSNILIFGQTEIESTCIKTIRENSKNIVFPKINGLVNIKSDTIQYEYSLVLLRHSSPETFMIFKKGILFPALILGASTDRKGKFQMSAIPFIGKLSISSFHELTITGQPPATKTFSFLLWQQNLTNPMLYILQLTNDKASSTTDGIEFIDGSRLTAFGFCSIII
jgi:hypothetical protein